MDQGTDIEQLIAGEIETLERSLRRLTEGPIPLRLWSKRAGGDLEEETEEQIAHLRQTIRIYEQVLANMNRRQPEWSRTVMAGALPVSVMASAAG